MTRKIINFNYVNFNLTGTCLLKKQVKGTQTKTSGYIYLPKTWVGKKVSVILQ